MFALASALEPATVASIAASTRIVSRFTGFTSSTSSPSSMAARMTSKNLALACFYCNVHKGTNLATVDPTTAQIVPLFNPRLDRWDEHFVRRGVLIVGLSAIGRATVQLLKMNATERLELRLEG
jgi:hypothetical protein